MRARLGLVCLFLGGWSGPALGGEPVLACEHGICFRFPGSEPELFDAPGPDGFGPFLMDHWEEGDRGYCQNYLGQDFDNCYRGHHGSDFMLVGGFREMDNDIPVVASARGEIIAADDSYYDHCHGSVIDLLKGGDGITCGIDPATGEPRPQNPNFVRIRHWNGRYYVYSVYYHLMQGSIPAWIKNALASGEYPDVNCGEPLGFVGSSGTSFAPHIHFEVRYRAGDVTGDYTGTAAIDPYCGPYSESTWSMWAELSSSDTLPGLSCQDPYDPLGPEAPPVGRCFSRGDVSAPALSSVRASAGRH